MAKLRKVVGNMDSHKYLCTCNIINDINVTCECLVFRKKDTYLCRIKRCHCSKSTRTVLENKIVLLLDWHGKSADLNPIENWRAMKKE